MMLVVSKSKQARQNRVNVDSMVSFDGISQSAIVQNPNLNAGVQSLSFLVHINSSFLLKKGLWELSETGLPIGRTLHIVIQDSKLYINSVYSRVATNFAENIDALSISGDSCISHLIFCSRLQTSNEIRQLHALGGIIPTSLHSAVVAHYPSTHFEGDVLVDVSDQYNYAKSKNYNNDPDFDGGGWQSLGTWVLEDGKLKHKGDQGGTNSQPAQQNSLTGNTDYEVHITIDSISNHEVNILLGTSSGMTSKKFSQPGSYVFYGNSGNSANLWIRMEPTSATTAQCVISQLDVFQKGKPLIKPYHAYLKNFTESEHTGVAQTAWKDFYSKTVQPLTVAEFVNTRYLLKQATGNDLFGTHMGIANGNAFTLNFHLQTSTAIPDTNKGYLFNLNSDRFALKFENGNNLYLTHWNQTLVNLKVGNLPAGESKHITLIHDGVNTLNCYDQDKLLYTYNLAPQTGNSVAILGGSRSASYRMLQDVRVASMRTYTAALSLSELKGILDYKEPASIKCNWRFESNGGIDLINGWYTSLEVGTGLIILDKKTLLPPFTNKALQIQASSKSQRIQLDNSLTESAGGEMHFFLYLDSVPSGAERYLFTSQHNSSQTHFFIENGNRLKFQNSYGPGLIRMRSDVIKIQPGWNHFGIKCGNVNNENNFRFYHNGRYVGNNVVTNNYNSIYNDFFPKYIGRQYLFTSWSSSNDTFPSGEQLDCRLVAFYASRGTFTNDKKILEAYNNGLFQLLSNAHTVLFGDFDNVHFLSDANSNFEAGHSWATGEGWAVTANTLQFTGAGGGRNSSVAINGIGDGGNNIGKQIYVTVNVSAIDRPSGGNGIGLALGSTSSKRYINSVGSHTRKLTYEGGGQGRLFISNDNGADSYTITSIVVWWYNAKDIGNARSCVLENYDPQDALTSRREIAEMQGSDPLHNGLALRLDRQYHERVFAYGSLYYAKHLQFWFYPNTDEDQSLYYDTVGDIIYAISLRKGGQQIEVWGNDADSAGKYQQNFVYNIPWKPGQWNFCLLSLRQSTPYESGIFLNSQWYTFTDIRFSSSGTQRIGHAYTYPSFDGYLAKLCYNGLQNSHHNIDAGLYAEYEGKYKYEHPTYPTTYRLPDDSNLSNFPASMDLGEGFSFITSNPNPQRSGIIYRRSGELISKE